MEKQEAQKIVNSIEELKDFSWGSESNGISYFVNNNSGQQLKLINVKGKPLKIRIYSLDLKNKHDIFIKKVSGGDVVIEKANNGNFKIIVPVEKIFNKEENN